MERRRFGGAFRRLVRRIEHMEQEGIVSPPDGTKPREVLREPERPS